MMMDTISTYARLEASHGSMMDTKHIDNDIIDHRP
jgi:hypothetical protein